MRSPKRELTLAIQSAGSVKAAAKGMGVHPSTVSRWKKRGVPKAQYDRLALYRAEQKEQRRAEKPDTSARDLRRMLKSAGTIKELARRLGYAASTVGRWLRVGIPKKGLARQNIALARESRAQRRAERKEETKRLKKLRRMAEKIMREQGTPLAPAKSFSKPLDGPRAAGWQWVWAIRQELTDEAIDEIEEWARSHKRKYPLWQMSFRLAFYSSEPTADIGAMFPRSGAVIPVQVKGEPDANQFVAEHSMAGPRNKSLSVVLRYLREQLEQMVLGTGTVFVLTVALWNYRLRPAEERARREREYRQARKSRKGKKR